jgi:hypothetical protein
LTMASSAISGLSGSMRGFWRLFRFALYAASASVRR